MPEPITIIALGLAAAEMVRRRSETPGDSSPPMEVPPVTTTDPRAWPGWLWPMPALGGRAPVISDGFSAAATDGHRKHLGVDIMYRRLPSEPPTLPQGSKHFYVPVNTPVLAAFSGKVWKADLSPKGHQIQIDHGSVSGIGPLNTYYQHLSSFARTWRRGDIVKAGDVLGIVGGSPIGYPLWHLHFELWVPAAGKPVSEWAIDPAPAMAKWQRAIQ